MDSEEYDIKKFTEDYSNHMLERSRKKDIVRIPFKRHLDLWKSHNNEAQRFLGFIIAATKSGDNAERTACIMQYKHHRRSQLRSLARLSHFQELSFWLDGVDDILEDSLVMSSISEYGVDSMKKAIEASKTAADNIWDIEKMSENLETSLNAMLSKMRARVDDDYLAEPQEQPAEPDQFDAEIEQAIKESENGTDTTSS